MSKYILVNLDEIKLTNQFNNIGSRMGYSIIEVDDFTYESHIKNIRHLLLERDIAVKGNKYWSEVRDKSSEYSTDDSGITQKVKVAVSEESLQCAVDLMKKVGIFCLTDIIDSRYNVIQSKYSSFEVSTWTIQIEEATKYLNDESANVPLISSLAESRGMELKDFASKVLEKSESYRTEIAELLVLQQTIQKKIESCSSIRELNKLYEEYFGIEMPFTQAIEEGLVNENGERTHPIEYGIKF
jgi:hypothetical protein